MLMGRYIFLIYLNGSTHSQAYWGLFKSWLWCLEMNLQSCPTVSASYPPFQATGPPMLPTCQACQVGFLHTHPGTLPIPVVNQAVLTHLVVSILTQQVPSTLPSLLWPLLVPVGMAQSARTLSEPLSAQQSVTGWDGGWRRRWIVPRQSSAPWNEQRNTWKGAPGTWGAGYPSRSRGSWGR